MVTDPVCECELEPDSAAASTEHDGETYYFCADGCKEKFESEPEAYV